MRRYWLMLMFAVLVLPQAAHASIGLVKAPGSEPGPGPVVDAGAGVEAPLFGGAALSDEELAEARGGFMLPSGAQIDFGAVITTSLDGVRLLETRLRSSAQGIASSVSAAPGVSVKINGVPTVAKELDAMTPSSRDGMPAAVASDPGGDYVRASVELQDFMVEQAIGRQISSLIINTGDNRLVDNQVTINLRLDDVPLLTVGSAAYQIQALSLDAAALRVP